MQFGHKKRRTSEEVRRDEIVQLQNDITKLRQKKADLRLELAKEKKDLRDEAVRARFEAIDQKIADKMQQAREIAMGAVKAVGTVAAAPAIAAKRVWDDWQV